MGTDELTRIHELAKRVTLLEKMVLRQQSRIDELTQALEAQHVTGTSTRPAQEREDAKERAAQEEVARSVPSVSDLLDEEMKRDLSRAYGAEAVPEQKPIKPQQGKVMSAMERAAGSYARATGGKEPVPSDRAKQDEATRKKAADVATLEEIPVHELRERTPAERAADYVRDYNALYEVPGTMFQKKKAQDDFIKLYEVQGMRCTNMQLRLSRPELEPRFVAVTPTRDADFWGMPLGSGLFAVVPNPFLVYGEEMHTAGGMREAFNSNYRAGNTYGRYTVKETATFQFGTVGKVFKKGQLEAGI
mgnify:CR=1 FL=1